MNVRLGECQTWRFECRYIATAAEKGCVTLPANRSDIPFSIIGR